MENIVLIGFMGSGKTTVGRWINKKKGMRMIDTDELIVKKEGRTINDIFATDGEEYFRNLETMVLKELIENKTDNTVLSVGGGLPIREENGELLRQFGRVVYLRAKVDTLVKRLSYDTSRPLLKGGDIRGKIEDLMLRRAEIYEKRANVIIDTDELKLEEIYERIEKS